MIYRRLQPEESAPIPANGKIRIRFEHGLGDCANFACMIPLYRSRGFEVEVQCKADKAPLFTAAGATIATETCPVHLWPHADAAGSWQNGDVWAGNKPAFNLSRSPLPNIGDRHDLWREYIDSSPRLTSSLRLST